MVPSKKKGELQSYRHQNPGEIDVVGRVSTPQWIAKHWVVPLEPRMYLPYNSALIQRFGVVPIVVQFASLPVQCVAVRYVIPGTSIQFRRQSAH